MVDNDGRRERKQVQVKKKKMEKDEIKIFGNDGEFSDESLFGPDNIFDMVEKKKQMIK